ncbi:hypothetical protein F4778DRAFT_793584 [Xylariomycetidae sp. FL2044]|nr:hypothetical protein F4778DRAFT_793584 [Xylariomycetidae sp. FL2044]
MDPKRRAETSAASTVKRIKLVSGPLPSLRYAWKQEYKDLAKRVAIEEECVRQGLVNGQRIVTAIEANLLILKSTRDFTETPALEKWIDDFNRVKEDFGSFESLVGFAGATGAGKTSCINCVLGYPLLLPTRNGRATTAVPCLIRWNADDTPGHEFRADILFKNRDSIREELDELLKGLRKTGAGHSGLVDDGDSEDDDEDDGDDDYDLQEERDVVQVGLHKAKVVWGLNQHQLLGMKAEEILSRRNDVSKLFGQKSAIYSGNATSFAKAIAPYLDSTERDLDSPEDQLTLWPLIDSVTVYVKSPILKNGVGLADLPGEGDAVQARGSVAESFYKKLDTTLILTPAVRACDEQTAVRLMTNNQEIQMRMNGQLKSTNFRVILTKTDDISQEANFTMSMQLKNNLQIQLDIQELNELDREHLILQNKYDELRVTGLDNQEAFESERKLLRHLKENRENYEFIDGRKAFNNVQVRNNFVVGRIEIDAQEREQSFLEQSQLDEGYDVQTNGIRVHSISCSAFWKLLQNEKQIAGFPDVNFTGIPELKSFIQDVTLEARHRRARKALNSLQGLLDQLTTWTSKGWIEQHTVCAREELEEAIHEEVYKVLEMRLDQHFQEIDKAVKRFDPTKSRKKDSLVKQSKDYIHPSTYTKIVSQNGALWRTRGKFKRTYDWMAMLTNLLLEQRVAWWDHIFHTEIPGLGTPAQEEIDSLWTEFVDRLLSLAGQKAPGIQLYLRSKQEVLFNVRRQIEDRVRQVLNDISRGAREIHPQVQGHIQQKMRKAFNEAIKIKGRRMMRKRQKVLIDHIMNIKNKVFSTACSVLRKLFQDHVRTIYDRLTPIIDEAKQLVDVQVNAILDSVQESAWKYSYTPETHALKIQLQEDLRPVVVAWDKDWAELDTSKYREDMVDQHAVPKEYLTFEQWRNIKPLSAEDALTAGIYNPIIDEPHPVEREDK